MLVNQLYFEGFAPPAPVRCQDDQDMRTFCPKFKTKGFCDTKFDVMEMICAATCDYCPKGFCLIYRCQLPSIEY